jgi:site-specific recombinase XerD
MTTNNRPSQHRNDHTLVSTTPSEAVRRYLEARERELPDQTIAEYRGKLSHFVDFCDREGIEDCSNLTGRDLHDYRVYRREESTEQVDRLSIKSMRDELYLLRNFLQVLEQQEAIRKGLHKNVEVPSLGPGEGIASEASGQSKRTRY